MKDTISGLVAGSALMRGTGDAALEILRGTRLKLRTFATGEYVFQPGDTADAIYLLRKAWHDGKELDIDPLVQLELRLSSAKRVLRFERVVHGEIFGELEMLAHGFLPAPTKRNTSALALTPASIVTLPLPLVVRLMNEDPIVRARLIRIGSQRLLSTLSRQHEKGQVFPDLLLADWLVELSADIGIAEGNRVRFPRKIAQSDIAADLGVSRETISRRLNEWERSGLLRTGARSQQIEIIDYQRISRLASIYTNRSRTALERTIDDIDAAIAAGDLIRARNIGLDVLRYYPSSPDLYHRVALSAARGGDTLGALEFLTSSGLPMTAPLSALEEVVLKAHRNPFLPMGRIIADPYVDDGFDDEENEAAGNEAGREAKLVEDLAALHARLLKEQAFVAEKPSDKRRYALASFEAYNGLFAAKQGFYPGINAATVALVAGDVKNAMEIASGLTAALRIDARDYWPLVTLAEALLILGRSDEARELLVSARDARGADDGAKASTILQLRRLATMVKFETEELVNALHPRSVAVITGHLFRGTELDAAQQDEIEVIIRRAAEQIFIERNVGFVYGALASGSDIILAETALALGARFQAVLPFGTTRFIKTSVEIGDPPGEPGKWEKRFRKILEGDHGDCSLTIMEPQDPLDRNIDAHFLYGFRYAAGCALQRAAVLQTTCRLVVVSDKADPTNVAGSNNAFSEWRDHGRPYDLIPFPYRRAVHPEGIKGKELFRPTVFLWDAAPEPKNGKVKLRQLCEVIDRSLECVERIHRDGRRGCCLIGDTVESAFKMGEAVAAAARQAKFPVRIICDFGPVIGFDLKPEKKMIARLQSADDFPGLPSQCVLATEAYAAQAKFDVGDDLLLIPLGRAETVLVNDGVEHQAIRPRPSLPLYLVRQVRRGDVRGERTNASSATQIEPLRSA